MTPADFELICHFVRKANLAKDRGNVAPTDFARGFYRGMARGFWRAAHSVCDSNDLSQPTKLRLCGPDPLENVELPQEVQS